MGIAVKQWLSNYSDGLEGSSHETMFIRQYRWNMLMKWRVPIIVDFSLALVQAAIVLFLAGLIILLWSVHPTVAIVISALAGLVLAFILMTLITSSAVASLADRAERLVRQLLYLIVFGLQQRIQHLQEYLRKAPSLGRLHGHVARFDAYLLKLKPYISAILARSLAARRGRESATVAEQRKSLSHDLFQWAYTISKDPKFLIGADICLPHHGDRSIVPYHDKIVRTITDRWSADFTKWPQGTFQSYRQLSLDILPIVQIVGKDREEDWREADRLFMQLTFNPHADSNDLNGTLRAASLMAVSPRSPDSVKLFLFTTLDPLESNSLRPAYTGKTLLWGIVAIHLTYRMSANTIPPAYSSAGRKTHGRGVHPRTPERHWKLPAGIHQLYCFPPKVLHGGSACHPLCWEGDTSRRFGFRCEGCCGPCCHRPGVFLPTAEK